jgi:excisionase family DNA binding protein
MAIMTRNLQALPRRFEIAMVTLRWSVRGIKYGGE